MSRYAHKNKLLSALKLYKNVFWQNVLPYCQKKKLWGGGWTPKTTFAYAPFYTQFVSYSIRSNIMYANREDRSGMIYLQFYNTITRIVLRFTITKYRSILITCFKIFWIAIIHQLYYIKFWKLFNSSSSLLF